MSGLMDNHTHILFRILPFPSNTNNKLLVVSIFSIIYLTTIILNSVVSAVICLDSHLHTPMYLFFCNLSIIDICYTTVIIPKLLYILLSGNDLVSFTQCFTQMYSLFIPASAEEILFFIMGYDRYVAICHPLHYHQILSMRKSTLMIVIMWVCAIINSSLIVIPLLNLTFDRVVSVHQIFCDAITVYAASHGGNMEFYIVMCTEWFLLGLCPLLCNLVSYIKIFGVLASMKSTEAQRKTFSTCASHLIVLVIYYSTGASYFTLSLLRTETLLNQVMSTFYSTVVPMINPLVYSLRNNELKKAFQKLLKIKQQ